MPEPPPSSPAWQGFHARALAGTMLLVISLTALGLFLAHRQVMSEAAASLQNDFRNQVSALHEIREVRHAALAERCRALARRPRIHAALEDDALDLLYLSAGDELRDIMEGEEEAGPDRLPYSLRAKFYRFLDGQGAVISPPPRLSAGVLTAAEEQQLSLPRAPAAMQIGYLLRGAAEGKSEAEEIVAMPIASSETGGVIATLVLGFTAAAPAGDAAGPRLRSGLYVQGKLGLPGLDPRAAAALAGEIARARGPAAPAARSLAVEAEGGRELLFWQQLNPGSLFPPAWEVVACPLAPSLERQERLRRRVLGGGAALLLAGLLASHFLARRLSVPVARLEEVSETNRTERRRAEAALELTSAELQRAARFSADASHQLKTPVTVLRAGLEELLSQADLRPELQEEVSALVHQTFRLTGIVEDLLLLSRMEAGRLSISFTRVDLTALIEALVDDLTALPDGLAVEIESHCPGFQIAGEKRYVALILENLLSNARKYNRPGGRIRIGCREEGAWARVAIANTGTPVPPEAQEHIFERFHRGTAGENVPGHGLGLNLARELARLHGGDLRLTRSDEQWTEFEVRFRLHRLEEAARTAAEGAAV